MTNVIPVAQILADGVMDIIPSPDLSGAIVHPKETTDGIGSFKAPLEFDSEEAAATRLHEYGHLNLITSGEQPIKLHAAFDKAGVHESILQAFADAKVMHHCTDKGLSLVKLKTFEYNEGLIIEQFSRLKPIEQATLILRSIGTELLPEAMKNTMRLTEADKVFVRKTYDKIKSIRTIHDWVLAALTFQRRFEGMRAKRARKEKEKTILGEGTERKDIGSKKRESPKEDMERFEKIAKKIEEEEEESEGEEEEAITELSTGEVKPRKERSEPKAKKLEVYGEKEDDDKENTEMSKLIQDIMDYAEELDEDVTQTHSSRTRHNLALELGSSRTEWGGMREIKPPLELNFEPKDRAKRLKRSFVGAFRYPHRLVSDSAVFASKQRGKGGTLLIDCSGSMGLTYNSILQVLEQRPFATIAIYAGAPGAMDGFLILVVDRGKRISEIELKAQYRKLGCGNIVDGPALKWLAKRPGEKFWICDGHVTGQDDMASTKLSYEAALIQRKYAVKRWRSLDRFLELKPPSFPATL